MSTARTQRKTKQLPPKENSGKKRQKRGTNQSTGTSVHLKPSNATFHPTQRWMEDAFDQFNNLLFNGTLKRPNFLIEDLDTEWGYYVPNEDSNLPNFWTLGIRDVFPSGKKFHEVMIHEMAHVYQDQYKCEAPNHGRSYKRIVTLAKEYGYNIDV